MSTKQCYPFPIGLDKERVTNSGDVSFIFNKNINKWFRVEDREVWKSPHIEMEYKIVENGDRWQPEFWSEWMDWDCSSLEDAIEQCESYMGLEQI